MNLIIGSTAPDFALKDQHGSLVTLSSFRGEKNVVVLFYPFSFSGTCTSELCELRDDLAPFQSDDVQLLAISCDPMYAQRAYAEKDGYKFQYLLTFGHMAPLLRLMEFSMKRAGVRFEEHLLSIKKEPCAGKSSIVWARLVIFLNIKKLSPPFNCSVIA